MQEEEFYFKSNGRDIHTYKWWNEDSEDKGIVQISHGMVEHAGRYDEFAERLTEEGFVVFANDHRGHGETVGACEGIVCFADRDGWRLVVEDMYNLTELIKEDYEGLPFFLFGHSMGSLLSRDYIYRHGEELDGLILSGTSSYPGFKIKILKMIARMQSFIKGGRSESPFLNNMVFGRYNKQFENTKTKFDWLSRDEEEVDEYIKDPECGNVPTVRFFLDLIDGIETVHEKKIIDRTPENLPILLISGDMDPVGNFGEGVEEVRDLYRYAGVTDVSCNLYEGARHELLHETNREEVFEDIIIWMDERIPQKE